MKFSLGISPCPNDTFIFNHLLHHSAYAQDIDVVLRDVQQLNEGVINNAFDIAKISCAALPLVSSNYVALRAGGAMGMGVGPLLITKNNYAIQNSFEQFLEQSITAVPGKNTTANFLFDFASGGKSIKVFIPFDEIENYVLKGNGPGVIIHENRFTYQQKNLHKIIDLGEYWEQQTGLPIPLGIIVIKRNIAAQYAVLINEAIKISMQHAWKIYPELPAFVVDNAKEMEEDVMRRHINLYVNEFSRDVGYEGKAAVRMFCKSSSVNAPLFFDEI